MPARRHNSSTSFTTKAVVSASQGSLAWLDLLTHLHISLAAGLLAQPCNLARATAFVGSSAFSGLWGRRLFSLKVGIIVPFSLPRQNTLLQHAMPRPGHLDSSRTCVANRVGAVLAVAHLAPLLAHSGIGSSWRLPLGRLLAVPPCMQCFLPLLRLLLLCCRTSLMLVL